ncbi:MAG: glycosyltransferase [Micrococcales bacterium]|nr:glycosyltransferase [Micrococcales bacterium]MCL2667093.1 glycosyltransferase [Micrococcales bacterium]
MKVLRISHSAVVDAWREGERVMRTQGLDVDLLCAKAWDEGGRVVALEPRPGEPVQGVRTIGSHPALFLFAPGPLWRALGRPHDLLDIQQEPYALVTAEILALRALRRGWDRLRGRRSHAPYLVSSAQNIFKWYPWPFSTLERRALRRSAGVSVCNDQAVSICKRKGAGGPVVNIPLGVDLSVFTPGPDGRTPSRTVGYAGRLVEHKGVDVLVKAVLADESLTLRIAGGGPDEDELRELAAAAGERITFLGSLGEPELVEFYRSIDVLAVPSLDATHGSRPGQGWVEQFGRVAVEAMACGAPVVASSSGALPDVVGDAGILVPPGDVEALGAALRQVVDDPELAATLRERGFPVAARCSWDSVATANGDLYRRVLGLVTVPEPPDPPLPEGIVVAYRHPEMVRTVLAPLAGKISLIVVDNSRLPEIREVAEAVGAQYVEGRGLGFAAGVNDGLAHRQCPDADVILLNSDAEVLFDDVVALQRAAHADPRTALVGPCEIEEGDLSPPRATWPFPSLGRFFLENIGLGRLPARRSRCFVACGVDFLRADALADVGGLDERYFLYFEDADWAYRARQRGWRNVLVHDVVTRHTGGATTRSDPERYEAHLHGSLEKYYRKHLGDRRWAVARAMGVVGSAARLLVRHGTRSRLHLYLAGPARVERELYLDTDASDDA